MRGDGPARHRSGATEREANAEDSSSVPASGAPLRTSACGSRPTVDYEEFAQRVYGVERTEPAEADGPNIPALAELLSRLEREEHRDGDELVKPWGITVGDLERPDKVSALLERLESVQRMTASRLRKEHEQRGFFTLDSNSSRSELIPSVCSVLVWEALSLPALRKVCADRGVATCEGDGRQQLLLRLAAPTWEEYGVCAESFQDLQTACAVADRIRGLESLGSTELMLQCRQWGMPVGSRSPAELTSQLKKALIWSRLPAGELREECRQRGVEAPDRDDALLRRLLGTFWGEWGMKLEPLELTEAFIKQFERLNYLSSSSLQAEYENRGLVVVPGVEDADLLRQLKDAAIWDNLPLNELRRQCSKLNLGAEAEEPHESLVRKLVEHACMASWRERGLLVMPTADYEGAVRMIKTSEAISTFTLVRLKSWYQEQGFPEEGDMSKEDLLTIARKVGVWQEMSVAELEKECRRRRLAVNCTQPEEDVDSHFHEMVNRLAQADRLDYWDSKGFQAHRMENFYRAVEVVEQYVGFESKSTSELQSICESTGVPSGSEALKERQKILEMLKKMLVWEALPVAELKAECQSLGLMPGTKQDDGDEDATGPLLERLKVDMCVKMCRGHYEGKGIPVERLSTWGVHNLWAQYDEIESWDTARLLDFYKEGYPAEAAMDRSELIQVVRLAYLWNELSVEELQKECRKRGVPQSKVPTPGGDKEKQKLEDLLQRHERMDAWEARGFRAHSMDRFEETCAIVSQFEDWKKKNFKELQKVYADTGYPRVTVEDKNELLSILKVVLVWEWLPLAELRRDCRQRHIRVQEGLPDERPESIRWLVHSTFANTWAPRGIPAERLGSIELAKELCKEVDCLHAMVLYREMVGQGTVALEEEYKKKGVPFDPKLEKQALLDRLRDLLVWKNLPLDELRRECRAHGIAISSEPAVPKATQNSLTMPSFLQGPPGARPGGRRLLAGTAPGKGGALAPNNKGPQARAGVVGNQPGTLLPPIPKSVKTNEVLGRIAQTKESKEEEEKVRHQLIDKLMRSTWRDTWKPRGIPAERLESIDVAEGLMREIDGLDALGKEGLKAEYEKRGLVFSEGKETADLAGQLRSVLVWQQMPVAELRRECRERDLQERCVDLEQNQLVDLLFFHSLLLETEAQGVPALSIPDWQEAVMSMEMADCQSLSELKEYYFKNLGFPEEQLQRAELVKFSKLVACWQLLTMKDLEAQCRLKGLPLEEDQADSNTRRERLIFHLSCEDRMAAWEERGYQARRIGNFDVVFNVVFNYVDYAAMGDLDLLEAWRKLGLPDKTMPRDERLRILKTSLIWESLPASEVRKECLARGLEVPPVSTGDNGEEDPLDMLDRLKLDLEVETNAELFEQRKIPVNRLGSLHAQRVRMELDRFEEMQSDELVQECWAMQFPADETLSRPSLLLALQTTLTWQCFTVKELWKDCVDRGLASEEESSTEKEDGREPNTVRGDLLSRLQRDLHVALNRSGYVERGIPVGRFGRGGNLKAYGICQRFEEMEEWDIDQLRAAQEECGLPPAPSQPRAELLSRLKDVAVWDAFPPEELQAECRQRAVQLPEPIPGAGLPNENSPADLRDKLRLHRCSKTFEEEKVPWKILRSCAKAMSVMRAWSELDDTPSSEMRSKYTEAVGLSPLGLELGELKERLKKVALWMDLPMEELQGTCIAHNVPPGLYEQRVSLVARLARMYWPPKPEPEKPKPKPKPKPAWPPPKGGYPSQGGYRFPFNAARSDSPRSKMAPYFQVLQLAKTAGIEEVKKSYRRLALKHHPDKNRGDGAADDKVACENFRKVAEAYEKLSEFFLNSSTKP